MKSNIFNFGDWKMDNVWIVEFLKFMEMQETGWREMIESL